MKEVDTSKVTVWQDTEYLEKSREDLRKRISREELESSWRLEAFDRLITGSQIDPASFNRLWLQPLIAAGATLEVALRCIVESHFQPN